MRIGITGSSGFLGWHVRAYLNTDSNIEIVPIDRKVFGDIRALTATLQTCDLLLHLAGERVFDSSQDEYRVQMEITERLLEALIASNTRIPIVFASSVSTEKDTPYGRAKRDASVLLRNWGARVDTPVSILVIPNMFGEFAQPYHHTVSATFCAELVANKTSTINNEGEVELVYVGDIARRIKQFITSPASGEERIQGVRISVPELYERLRYFCDTYRSGVFPQLVTVFDKQLFNMLYAVLFEVDTPRSIEFSSDERGSLIEMVRTHSAGQTFLSFTKPGCVRGNHYHTRKIERFMVVNGEATIRLRKLFSDRVLTYRVSSKAPVFIDMPTFYTHNIENTGSKELTTLFWTNELYDLQDPDTIPEMVT